MKRNRLLIALSVSILLMGCGPKPEVSPTAPLPTDGTHGVMPTGCEDLRQRGGTC